MEILNSKDFPLKPLFQEKSVTVAFGSSFSHLPFVSVVLYSIFENSRKDYNYEILILVQEEIDSLYREAFSLMKEDLKNFHFRFLNVSDFFQDTSLFFTGNRASAYHRLFLPFVYEGSKVLYLDTDVIVQEDIVTLYETNLDNYCVGAIKDYWFSLHLEEPFDFPSKRFGKYEGTYREYAKDYLKLGNPENYFNSGVLLFNLEEIRKKNIHAQLIDFKSYNERNTYFVDQDWLNIIFESSHKILDKRWNTFSHEITDISQKKEGIWHYAGSHPRPWEDFSKMKIKNGSSFEWWKYAKKSPLLEVIYSYQIEKEREKIKVSFNLMRKEIEKMSLKNQIKKIIRKIFTFSK